MGAGEGVPNPVFIHLDVFKAMEGMRNLFYTISCLYLLRFCASTYFHICSCDLYKVETIHTNEGLVLVGCLLVMLYAYESSVNP